jgi:hypothetical protein
VLNLQTGTKTLDFSRVGIYFDAPLLMDLLALGDSEASAFAKQLFEAIKVAGGKVTTFSHCVEEIKSNIDGALREYEAGRAFGPTGMRLGQSTHLHYVRDVRLDVEDALRRVDVAVDRLDFARLGAFCSSAQEEKLRNVLGTFINPVAQQRDAASIANVLRLRKQLPTPAARPDEWKAIFVTENDRIARSSRSFAIQEGMAREEDIASAVTDRFFAGLIWAATGGKTRDLPRAKLIANCTAALSPELDVVAKASKFISALDPDRAAHFRAMMTDQRSGLYLMTLTLGDGKLVTQENFAQLFREIEDKIEQRAHSQASDEWRAKLAAMEEDQQATIDRLAAEFDSYRLSATTAEFERGQQLQKLQLDLQNNRDALDSIKQSERAREARVIATALAQAKRSGLRFRRGLIAVTLLMYLFALYFGADRINPQFGTVSLGWQWLWIIGVPFVVTGLGFWPDLANAVERIVAQTQFAAALKRSGQEELMDRYNIDFATGQAERKE